MLWFNSLPTIYICKFSQLVQTLHRYNHGSSCHVSTTFVTFLPNLKFHRKLHNKFSCVKFEENLFSGRPVITWGKITTHTHTHTHMTKLIVPYDNFFEIYKNTCVNIVDFSSKVRFQNKFPRDTLYNRRQPKYKLLVSKIFIFLSAT